MLNEIGDILFSVIVGYMGALEFFFIARHLYHWTMRHCQKYDENTLANIQEQLKSAIAVAAEREKNGYKAMEDGVLYKDGFRIDPNSPEINIRLPETLLAEIPSSSENLSQKEVLNEPERKLPDNTTHTITQTLKTQFSQDPEQDIRHSFKSKLKKPENISEESIEPQSSKSSFSTQFSSEGPPILEDRDREDPEGESTQYHDDYLRSLDGLKNKPLQRDDGTGRRRAHKVRRSSDSSNSSRDSRTSRDEELKMFTSLEEKEQGSSDFVPIQYNEQNLKVKPYRRHKRSPVHESKRPDSTGSLPIDEEDDYAFDLTTDEEKAREVRQSPFPTNNVHNSSSFEEATIDQHEDVLSNIYAKGPQSEPMKPNDAENVSIEDTTASAASLPFNAFANEIQQPSNTFPDQDHYGSSHAGGKSVIEEPKIEEKSMDPGQNFSRQAEDELMEKLTNLKIEHDLKTQTFEFVNEERHFEEIRHSEDREIELLRQHSNTPNPQTEDMSLEENLSNMNDCNLNKNEKEEIVEDLELEQRTRMLEDEHLSNVSKNLVTPPTITVVKAPEEEVPKILEIRVLKVQIVESSPRSSPNAKLPEGVSTFYDFNASVSREPSPEPTMDIRTYNIQETSSSRESSVGKDFSREPSAEPFKKALSLTPISASIEESSAFGEKPSEPTQSSTSKPLTIDIQPEKKENYRRRLLEDISPFYDFNASVNPWFFKRQSVSENKPTKEDLEDGLKFRSAKNRRVSIKTIRKQINKFDICLEEGISDFFDFNMSISKSNSTSPEYSTSRSNSKDRDLPVIILPNNGALKYDGPKCNTAGTRHLSIAMVDNDFQRADPFRQKSPSPKCFSADNTFMSMEILDRNFKRSTYVGESTEFTDHLNYRREFTKTFRRSESKSPSPVNKIASNTRMLDEEFKGAINFPYDYERRASDTALLQKNEILFQIQDFDTITEGFEKDEDYLNGLEEDEYHHFRRFSLNQCFREGTSDSDSYIQEIEVRTLSGEKVSTWVNSSPFESSPLDNTSSQGSLFDKSGDISTSITSMSEGKDDYQDYTEDAQTEELSKSSLLFIDDLLQSLDENECSGSEDERQTVYEVGDFIPQSLDDSDAGKQLIEDTALALQLNTKQDLESEKWINDTQVVVTASNPISQDVEEKQHISEIGVALESPYKDLNSFVTSETDKLFTEDLNVANENEVVNKTNYFIDISDRYEKESVNEETTLYKNLQVIDESESDSAIALKPSNFISSNKEMKTVIVDFIAFEKFHTESICQIITPPKDEDYIEIDEIYVDAIKDRKQSGLLREFESLVDDNDVVQEHEDHLIPLMAIDDLLQNVDENDLTGSEDERLTVVEVDDGIVSDDRNDESFTEQSHSECELADREADRQWIEEAAIVLQPVAQFIQQNVPSPNDDDSVQIDKIYVDAIRNRKQSGILRDYDSLALDSADIYSGNEDLLQEILGQEYKDVFKRSNSVTSEGSYYGPTDRKDRYLGDAIADARTSVRQRARYGLTQKFENLEEDIEVDLSYVPKKEYNWRKNFKIDDDEEKKVFIDPISVEEPFEEARSPSVLSEDAVKKKKTKKKLRNSSRSSLDDESNMSFSPQNIDDDDNFGEHYKSPSIESRRSKSRFSLEELESRRSSIHLGEEISNNFEETTEVEIKKKKVKKIKRKKSKGDIKEETLGSIEQSYLNGEISYETLVEFGGQGLIQERRDSKSRTGTVKKKRKSKEAISPLTGELKEGIQLGDGDIFERNVEKSPISVDSVNHENLKINKLAENQINYELTQDNLQMLDSNKTELQNAELTKNEPKEESSKSSKLQKAQTDSFDFVKDSGFYPLF